LTRTGQGRLCGDCVVFVDFNLLNANKLVDKLFVKKTALFGTVSFFNEE